MRTWSASYTLKEAALIIANFHFESEAKRKNLTNAIFSEFTVCGCGFGYVNDGDDDIIDVDDRGDDNGNDDVHLLDIQRHIVQMS